MSDKTTPDFAKFEYAWFSKPTLGHPMFVLFFEQEGFSATLRLAGAEKLGHWFSHEDRKISGEITVEEAAMLLEKLGGKEV